MAEDLREREKWLTALKRFRFSTREPRPDIIADDFCRCHCEQWRAIGGGFKPD